MAPKIEVGLVSDVVFQSMAKLIRDTVRRAIVVGRFSHFFVFETVMSPLQFGDGAKEYRQAHLFGKQFPALEEIGWPI